MPEVLTERETTRQLFDQGCEKYGIVPFMREVNTLLEHGHRVNDALRQAGVVIDLAILRADVVEAAKAWKQKADDGDNEKWSRHYVKMCDAIQALIDFESQVKK